MAYRELGVIELREVWRRYSQGEGLRAIARGLGAVVARLLWKMEMAHSSGELSWTTTNEPSVRTATGGTRHGRGYQEVGAAA
jgi:hypothetical protein